MTRIFLNLRYIFSKYSRNNYGKEKDRMVEEKNRIVACHVTEKNRMAEEYKTSLQWLSQMSENDAIEKKQLRLQMNKLTKDLSNQEHEYSKKLKQQKEEVICLHIIHRIKLFNINAIYFGSLKLTQI